MFWQAAQLVINKHDYHKTCNKWYKYGNLTIIKPVFETGAAPGLGYIIQSPTNQANKIISHPEYILSHMWQMNISNSALAFCSKRNHKYTEEKNMSNLSIGSERYRRLAAADNLTNVCSSQSLNNLRLVNTTRVSMTQLACTNNATQWPCQRLITDFI